MFDIKRFSSEFNRRGFVKPSNFSMTCFSPIGMADVARNMVYRIKSVDLPGRGAQVSDHAYYGIANHIATGSIMAEININVILSEDHREREYFESWMDIIVGNYRVGHDEGAYDLGFYEDYVGSFEIANYNEVGEVMRITKLIEAFPSAIGNISLDWDTNTELAILPVTIQYKKYENI